MQETAPSNDKISSKIMVLPVVIGVPVAAVVLCAIGVPVGLYVIKPDLLVKLFMRYGMRSAGLKIKTIEGNDITFCYAERGIPNPDVPSLLFIHGFTASKDMWSTIIKKMPQNLHTIVVDLPGHGDTLTKVDEDMTFKGQVKRVHEFAELIGLTNGKYHVIGQSMGGAISGLYAATYPEEVGLVTMICPAMETPEMSDFTHHIASTGNVVLLPETVEDIAEMMTFIMHKPIKVPKQILKGALGLRQPKMDYYRKLFLALVEDRGALNESMGSITVPSQVIWGKHDKLIHVSGAEVLHKGLPSCHRLDLIPECGHSTNMERPGMVTKLLLKFRELEKNYDPIDIDNNANGSTVLNETSAEKVPILEAWLAEKKASL
ncbi:unnamed protein product [Owenia fusiformis]|uniref:acylglycerol lipase n=1 Tax=Owenia fusiformis TaxID=6347 RepID=A0A8J1T518_OWEFU|nr:unnamed protein product [Owenia fusiformis]